jgi:hypothetical protein
LRYDRQRGFISIEMGFYMVLATILSFVGWQAYQRSADADIAKLQADALLDMRSAANKLLMDNYAAYQSASPVTRNGITLASGTTAGQSFRPTVANLRSMDLGVNDAQDYGVYKTLTKATYDITIARSNACATNPSDTLCQVTGLVCLNQPARSWSDSSSAGTVDGVGIGVMLSKLGGYGGSSLLGSNSSTVYATNGTWSLPNPYGAVAGIMCARFGWGTENDDYLRRNDTRDPNFQGSVTVKGDITSTAGSVGAGKGTDSGGQTCTLGAILNSGQILSRSANCIRRTWMDGSTGQIGAADANGTTRLLIDGNTGGLSSKDAAGNDRAGIKYDGAGQSVLYADNLLNNAGTAGIKSDGTVFGTMGNFSNVTLGAATLNATSTLGGSCSPDGGMSWAIQGTKWTMARCTGGVWTSIGGTREGTVGGACGGVNGVTGIAANGEQLLCQGGSWIRTMDRFGRTVLMASFVVRNGYTVDKPSCLAGSTGTAAYMALGSEQQGLQFANRQLTDIGSQWVVTIANGSGVAILGDVVVLTYCVY